MKYVVVFLVTESRRHVAFVRKTSGPDVVVGRLNGIGGKIEPGESSRDAARRECLEETGFKIDFMQPRVCMIGTDWRIDFYIAYVPNDSYAKLPPANDIDEEMNFFPLKNLSRLNIVPNVMWLLPLCMDTHIMPVQVMDVS